MAEVVGFELTVPSGTLVFKTSALNHSATLPYYTNKKPDLFGIGFVYYSYFCITYTNPFDPIKPVFSLFGER